MSIIALNWAFKQPLKNSTQKLVLVALADASDDYGICWPSYQSMALKCSITRRSVIRCMKDLIDEGLVKAAGRYNHKGQTSNAYSLNIGVNIPEDHPLKGVVTECHRGSDTVSPGGCQNVTGVVTQCHPNHNRTLIEPERERDALSREQFLREVNKGFHDGAFNVEGISHLSEDVIQLQAEECFDRWGQSLKGRDAPVALRSWLRKGQQLGTVEKPPKFLDANQVTQRAEPDNPIQPWHERISERLDEDVFNAWFRPVVFEDGILYAPSRFHAQYITQHYSHDIQAVFNQETPIEFKKPQPQKEKELA